LWGELATQLLLTAAPSCRAAHFRPALHLHSARAAPSREQLLVVMLEQFTFPWASRRNFGTHSFDSCLLMTFLSSCVSVAVGEVGTHGRGHIHATAAQRNVRSNPLLKAHLGDVASRKRVGLVRSSESAAQWHHNQRFRCLLPLPRKPQPRTEFSD